MEPNWADLEELPLSLILDKLEEGIDHVYFGAVCKSWQSIAKLNHENHQFRTNMLPMLMIPTRRWKSDKRIKKRLYGILSETVYPFQLYHSHSMRCRGSSHGWLALVDASDSITLFNPFKKYIAPIGLPPLIFVYKITLSADPITSPNDYMVAAIYSSGYLAYLRAGQTFWTFIDTNYFSFADVIFYKGLVFAVSRQNTIVSFNPCYLVNGPFWNEKITAHIVLEEGLGVFGFPEFYLVKSLTGDLWMVRKTTGWWVRFDVFKLELNAQSGKLEQMVTLESLEDNILFLGSSSDSISVSASYFSKSLENDSIYYADDLNIYNVKDGSFARHCPISFEQTPLPFWVLPQFQWD